MAVVLPWLAALALGGSAAQPPPAAGTVEWTTCAELGFAAADFGPGVECGWFAVPETRAAPGSRTLRLAVVVARATGPQAAEDPILYLHGGPGIATLDVVPRALRGQSWPLLRARRDLVFFDQRGTGRSRPVLCATFNAALDALNANPVAPAVEANRKTAAAERCRAEMRAEGADPAAYTSTAIAADVEALRRALGYRAWNVFATSFGTLPAVEMIRRYPGSVRALILDSAFPPNTDNRAELISATAASLAAVQRRCDASPGCRQPYGDLRARAARTITRLNETPLATANGRINGGSFMQALWTMLVVSDLVPHVPEMLRRADAGDDAMIRRAVAAFGGPGTFGGYSHAQAWLVNCHDAFPRPSAPLIARAIAEHRDIATDLLADSQDRVCAAIQPQVADPAFFAPPPLEVPALVYFGEFDPATPRPDALAAMRILPHGTLVDISGASHAPFYRNACTRGIAVAFLDAPGARPDLSCVAALPTFAFSDAEAFNTFLTTLPE